MIREKGFHSYLWSFVPSGLSQEGSNLTTLKPYNLELVTEMTMCGAAHTRRIPPVQRALSWADWYCAFSAFSHPRYGGKGKDHSGVAARQIVRIAKKESAV